jgi:methionine synthase / methylenetetrahydrofolate reductase(NADPH)
MLDTVERMAAATERPLSAQPNAGLPREVDGRKIYMASPEYMAKYAARLIRKGARFVGGCCGTTPEHIARIADAVRALTPASTSGGRRARAERRRRQEPVPLAERSALGRRSSRAASS